MAEGKVAEADGCKSGEAGADGGVLGEEREGVGDAGVEEIGDGFFVPRDCEGFGFETAPFADGAGDKNIGEKLHLDAFVAKALAMIAASVAGVEREGGRAEAGGEGGGFLSVEFADEVPSFAVESGVGTRGAGKGRLIDEHDLVKEIIALDGANGGDGVGELVAAREQTLVDDVVKKSGLAGAGNAAEGDEAAEGNRDIEVVKIVQSSAAEGEAGGSGGDGAAGIRKVDTEMAGEVTAGEAGGATEEAREIASEDDVAAARARLGADLDDVVGGADHGLVVLDDDNCVAGVGKVADNGDESFDIARVEADGGLVEDEESIDEGGAEARGEVDALDLAAGEGFGGAIEGEIAETDLLEVAQAGAHGVEG